MKRFDLWAAGWSILAIAGLLSAVSRSRADTVQLTNGDVLHGTVDWLNENSLQISSEVHGELRIKRDKVAAIALGEHPLPVAAPPAADAAAGNASPARAKTAPAQSLDELVKQLQTGGVDLKDLQDVQKAFPLIAAPEAQKEFTRMLGGLMNGTFGVGDLRREAIHARDQIKELSDELGPEATTGLQGYLGILNRFIDESAPPPAKTPPAKTAPQAPTQAAPLQPVPSQPAPPQPAPPTGSKP